MDTLRLHLGCGIRDFGKDWIHIDYANYAHIDSHDVKRLPYPDNSVSEIYASHLISYFDREEIPVILKEWNRVISPSGELKLAVPDLEAMASLYAGGKFPIEDFLGPLYGKMYTETDTRCGVYATAPIYHRTAYDYRSLSKVLFRAGFHSIQRWKFGGFYGDDHSWAYQPEGNIAEGTSISLNVIATK